MAAAPTIVYLPVSAQEGNTLSVISSEASQAAKNITELREAALPIVVCFIYYMSNCFMDAAQAFIRTKKNACYTNEHCAI